MLGKWTPELQSFRDHVTELVLKDEAGDPLDLSDWFIKFDVVHDEGTVTWSTVTGHVAITSPATDGKVVLTVPKAEVAALPFAWANFSFYAGPTADSADLIYEGKVKTS